VLIFSELRGKIKMRSLEKQQNLARLVLHKAEYEIYEMLDDGLIVPFDFLKFSEDSEDKDILLRYSPLEIAAREQYWTIVSLMLKSLLRPDSLSEDAQRDQMQLMLSKILLMTAFYQQTDLVLQLIDAGADVNYMVTAAGKFRGCGPLHYAVYYRDDKAVARLVEAGADRLLPLRDTPSVVDFAISLARYRDKAYWRLIPLLTPRMSTMDEDANKAYAKALLMAMAYNRIEVVKHLLSVGADPNRMVISSGEFAGYAPLHLAYHHNSREAAYYLLAAGADPKKTAENGSTFTELVGNYDPRLVKLLTFSKPEREERVKIILIDFLIVL
jgi:ankyrin repeat protein